MTDITERGRRGLRKIAVVRAPSWTCPGRSRSVAKAAEAGALSAQPGAEAR